MIKEAFKKWLKIESNIKSLQSGDALVSFFGGANDFNLTAAIASFSSNPWVNSAVSIRSEVFATVNFYLKDDKGERIDDSPILTLLKKPSPYITRFNMMQLVSIHQDLAGNAYWKYDFEGEGKNRRVIRIQPLMPQYVTIKVSGTDFIDYYEYTLNGQIYKFPADEVTHFLLPNPNSLVQGIAPVQSASYAVDTEEQSNKWNYNFFKNGGAVGAILEHDNTLTKDVKDRLKRGFDAAHKGDKKAFKTIVLDGGLKLKESKISQKDMEFSQLQLTNRDKVIGVYRVPKILLAQYEGGSLAEAETAENVFAKYTMTPRLQSFTESLNLDYMPLWGKEAEGKILKFDSIVKEDKDFNLQKADAALNKWMTINERRLAEGLDEIDGGDELYQAVSQVPLTFSTEVIADETTTTEKNVELDIVKKEMKEYPAEFKAKFEQKFLINHALLELKFIKKLKNVFAKQKKEVLEALRANKNYKLTKSLSDDVFNTNKETQKFVKVFTPLIAAIVEQQGDEVNSFFALGVGPVADLPSFQPAVDAMTLEFAQEVNRTTKRQIKEALAEGLGAGESVDDLGKRMKGIFKEASTVRSQTIARTETTKASSTGSLLTYKESDVVDGKEWLTTLDDRTRTEPFDHVIANGEVVELDEDFVKTGESLPAPGVDGSAANTINCRCAMLPVIIT